MGKIKYYKDFLTLEFIQNELSINGLVSRLRRMSISEAAWKANGLMTDHEMGPLNQEHTLSAAW